MSTKQYTYFVQGTHCSSCELIIEKTLLSMGNIKSVDVSNAKGEVQIAYEGDRPSAEKLNDIFRKEKYVFAEKPFLKERKNTSKLPFIIAGIMIIGFLALQRTGFSSLVNVNTGSPLPAFFIFGILAGLSTCAALVGGLVLSMAKQWTALYGEKVRLADKIKPHLMFNLGRIISYFVLGSLLGALGSKIGFSLQSMAFFVILVSVAMGLLGLQMLGVKSLQKFQIALPKSLTKNIADEKKFKGKYMPLIMGALTFFLPCGFTITAQGLALVSGSWLSGGLVMLAFVLGTTPVLLGIGLSSVKFLENQKWSGQFLKTAGVLVLFFALFNLNNQFNVLGWPSFNDLSTKAASLDNGDNSNSGSNLSGSGLPEIIGEKQVIKMEASSAGYKPNYFTVKAGQPVRWEITDTGTSGCTNAVIAGGLFSGQIPLTPGQVSVKEFIAPTQPGKYKFSCWMGMITGMIEVVANNGANIGNPSGVVASTAEVPSGAKGCGCGGGGSTSGSGNCH
ncbi:MAG: sulfite exporter TauE/SafE family protein [Candidatus Gribaldobacteria bacterium]|nr:sulfite exporter TauE/SafE family protein [Candidatus Gribaldobacteria bacterium]